MPKWSARRWVMLVWSIVVLGALYPLYRWAGPDCGQACPGYDPRMIAVTGMIIFVWPLGLLGIWLVTAIMGWIRRSLNSTRTRP